MVGPVDEFENGLRLLAERSGVIVYLFLLNRGRDCF